MSKEYFTTISRHLFHVLGIAGASEYVRKIWQQTARSLDVLTTLLMRFEGSSVAIYTFGSSSEGTTTPDLSSDTDTMMCFLMFPVFEVASDIQPEDFVNRPEFGTLDGSELSYILMVQDENTPTGYVKLEFVASNEEITQQCGYLLQFEKDVNGKDVLVNSRMIEAMSHDERNGPAATTLKRPGFTDLDYIPSFLCRKWPSVAEEFFSRKRNVDFPTKDMMSEFRNYGIFLVPTGHAQSPERHLQWRLSFSMQERMIMRNLNETQYKCYILLKMMKEDFVKPVVPGKSLTSYHCKTSMFFAMETKADLLWIKDNLVECFVRCVTLLRMWVENGFVPSYFMPSVNLWKGDREVQSKVVAVLENILLDVPKALLSIRCERVGVFLKEAVEPAVNNIPAVTDDSIDPASEDYFHHSKRNLHLLVHRLHYTFTGETLRMAKDFILNTRKGDDLAKCTKSLRGLVALLRNSKKLSEITSQDIRDAEEAASFVLPFVYTSLGSQVATKAIVTSDHGLEEESLGYLEKGQISDFLAGNVKLAAVLFAMGKYQQCLNLLKHLDKTLGNDVITQGMCGKDSVNYTHRILVNEALVNKILTEKPTSKDLLVNNMATCVIFLPTEIPLIPKDLQYELFRSFVSQSEAVPDIDDWYEIVAVDSKILLFYLLYRVHEKLGNDEDKMAAFVFLNATLEDDYNLCHFDTANNLIGCILREMGHLGAALTAFRDSWRRRPDHNAAKWHALITCFEFFKLMQNE